MPGGIHHVVHAVRDLDAAGETYRRLGFQVGGRNRHPWGTENRIVQLGRSYIELLSIAAPKNIPPHGPGSFSFGAFNRDFLARREGLAMVALESRDVEADAAIFRTAGIGDFEVFHFHREGSGPGGRTVKVAFSLVFAADRRAPQAGFFACQEHFPENFWNPAVQVHRNSGGGVAGIVLVARAPGRFSGFLSGFAGVGDVGADMGRVKVTMPGGTMEAIDPADFQRRFGTQPPDDPVDGLTIAAIRFAVRDFAAAVAALKAGSVDAQVRDGHITIGPDVAHGATLVLEAS